MGRITKESFINALGVYYTKSNGERELLRGLYKLGEAVKYLSETYREFDNLNADVDISQIIAMSLDEWYQEINIKIEQLEGVEIA